MSFFQNTCKPEGLGGKIMLHICIDIIDCA